MCGLNFAILICHPWYNIGNRRRKSKKRNKDNNYQVSWMHLLNMYADGSAEFNSCVWLKRKIIHSICDRWLAFLMHIARYLCGVGTMSNGICVAPAPPHDALSICLAWQWPKPKAIWNRFIGEMMKNQEQVCNMLVVVRAWNF